MEKNYIASIIRKYLSCRFSGETEERIQKWIIKEKDTREKEEASFLYWQELKNETASDTYTALRRVNRRIGYRPEVSFYKKISHIAAVIIPLLILAGGYLYYDTTQKKWVEVTVAYGEEKHLLLPDSSEVWINAGTTLSYPQKFLRNQRLVRLNGEAYFSVQHDPSKTFVVQTEQFSVKVLGTRFNVKAYTGEEKATATLTSGKVEVNMEDNKSLTLKPNERLIYNRSTSSVEIVQIAPNETNSWMMGQLIFSNSSLPEIVQTLERRFDVSIHNNTGITNSRLYTVKFLKNETIEEILNVLEDIAGFTYTKEKSRIILTKK